MSKYCTQEAIYSEDACCRNEIVNLKDKLAEINERIRWRKQSVEPIEVDAGEFVEVIIVDDVLSSLGEHNIAPLRHVIAERLYGKTLAAPHGILWDTRAVVYWRPCPLNDLPDEVRAGIKKTSCFKDS